LFSFILKPSFRFVELGWCKPFIALDSAKISQQEPNELVLAS